MKLRSGCHLDRPLIANPKHAIEIGPRNASSSLLKLPSELKSIIYREICGGHFIHVKPGDGRNASFTSAICYATLSEEDAKTEFRRETKHPWYAPGIENRHLLCGAAIQRSWWATVMAACDLPQPRRPTSLNLSFLRSCRQIYDEARQIPYSTNTFSFDSAYVLDAFITALVRKGNQGSHNHLAIRSLHLRIAENEWRRLDWGVRLTSRFTGLQHVGISLEYTDNWGLMPGCPHTPTEYEKDLRERMADPEWSDKAVRYREPLLFNIFKLCELRLESATVVVSDFIAERATYNRVEFDQKSRWTIAEKQERARYFKDVMLRRVVAV